MQDNLIEKLIEYLQNSQDFLLEQMPEVIQQALTYEKMSAYFSAGLMLVLLIIGLSIAFYAWKHPKLDSYGHRSGPSLFALLVSLGFSPLFFVQICISIDKLLKIYVAPKYYLIQLFVNLKRH